MLFSILCKNVVLIAISYNCNRNANKKILHRDASLRKGPKKGLVYTTGTRKMKLHMHILQVTARLWSTLVVIGFQKNYVVIGHSFHWDS